MDESGRADGISVRCWVAVNCLNLRGLHQQIAIAQENLAVQQRSAELAHKRFDAGFASRLDVASADAQTATTLSQIPSWKRRSDRPSTIKVLCWAAEPFGPGGLASVCVSGGTC